jgi:hypothetical protein
MKKLLLISLLAAGTANAECYMRSNIVLSQQTVNSTAKDTIQLVVPDRAGFLCSVRYRLLVNKDWQTIDGEATGRTEAEACAQAVDIGRGRILEDVEPRMIRADNQMVCSDLPDIRVRPVRIGETIWETETDAHLNPEERGYFKYKNSKCRMFVERNNKNQNLFVYQGIICQITSLPNSKWRVIDKY